MRRRCAGALRPDEARTILRAFRPKPWPTDRAAAATEIDQMQVDPGAYVVWLSDGLEDEGAAKLTERLRRFDGLQVILPDQATTPLLLLPPAAEGRDLKVQALRPVADGPRKVAVQAADEQGRVVARIDLDFAATATKGEGVLPAPAELRNRMARLDIEAQGGAGSAVLLDERIAPPAGRHPGRARRPRAASRCCRRSTSSNARSIPMSASPSAIARRC